MTVAEMVEAEEQLAERLTPYAGRWVAVINYRVEFDADSLSALLEQIPQEASEDSTVFQVPENGDSACYF